VAYVYLLHCADGSLYCGWTTDVAQRIARHATGKASKYTAARRPVTLAAAWELPTRSDARRMEARVKALTRGEKLALLHGDPPEGAVRFALPAA
jgi:predicted GIY-YIG superfamily endonuclease